MRPGRRPGCDGEFQNGNDAMLICALRNAAPALLDERDALRTALARLLATVEATALFTEGRLVEITKLDRVTVRVLEDDGITLLETDPHERNRWQERARRAGSAELWSAEVLERRAASMGVQLTLTSPPEPSHPPTPTEARDETLAALERFRAEAVKLGRAAADELVAQNGKVTSVEVLALLRERGHSPLLDSVDPRFMGAVFSPKKWTRVNLANTGSKGRAVSVWSLR